MHTQFESFWFRYVVLTAFAMGISLTGIAQTVVAPAQTPAPVAIFPMERTAYFIGEIVPLAISGIAPNSDIRLEAVNSDGKILLYAGKNNILWLNTASLAPGDYQLLINGTTAFDRMTLTSPLRKSAGSTQDECMPRDPEYTNEERKDPVKAAAKTKAHWDSIDKIFKESGLTAAFSLGASDAGRIGSLDVMARSGAITMVNPDTRPTSFFPVGNNPAEINGMSQRMILTAQANGRYPNFGGFCYGWDTTGYAVNGRLGLLTYWGWGNQTQNLRDYIANDNKVKLEEFTRRTGMKPVTGAEYISYLTSIGRPEFAPAIDLPTLRWLEEIAKYSKPMSDTDRIAFEKRLDAWSSYLMGLYKEGYSAFSKNLRSVDPSIKNTSSVQVDHCPTLQGQYFPEAYSPLDLQYQSTWNDQVGGPDYLNQSLFVTALLEMNRGNKPTWVSNAMASAHGLSDLPGKMMRTTAQGLAFGGTGNGFACEGFSNLLGGMNRATNWENIKGKSGEMDVISARDFLDRFSSLSVNGHTNHGVGILFSKTQYGRQYVAMGYGTAAFKALTALTRLGYTPRFVTEEELQANQVTDVKALIIIGQTMPLPTSVNAGIASYIKQGGKLLIDGSTSVSFPGASKISYSFPFSQAGKPHSWGAPNMVNGDNDTILYERWHPELAKAFSSALGDTGHACFTSYKGTGAKASILQIDGGTDAKYLIATNDSHIKNQADWYQIKETLLPAKSLSANAVIYDCTEEQSLGTVKPLICDLTQTTARVYAILPRGIAATALSATQKVSTGETLSIQVEFIDAGKKKLNAVLPFNLSIIHPDGTIYQEFYRATTDKGTFNISIPLPINAPAGKWTVAVRSQLNGTLTSLPVTVESAKTPVLMTPMIDTVIVRERGLIESMLSKGSTVVVPIFDSPQSSTYQKTAEELKKILETRGVTVDIRLKPEMNTYTIGYSLSPAQVTENSKAENGQAIGKIKRETLNGNDWDSGLSGYRFYQPIILLDIAGLKDDKGKAVSDNPMAESLDNTGILWPKVTAAFPGSGRAVVQGVHWAFGAKIPALVIQAADMDGIMAGIRALDKLPEDKLTPQIQNAKATLFREYYIGGQPEQSKSGRLSAKGLTTTIKPKPLTLTFTDAKPLPVEEVAFPKPSEKTYYPAPAKFEPKQYVIQLRMPEGYIDSDTASFLVPDMRFSDAVMLPLDIAQEGKVHITADGLFRYSDRQPCWQAQWEDIINLREKVVPKERRPIQFTIQIDGKDAGTISDVITRDREVKLELASSSAGMKPKSVVEEVVVQVSGDIILPAGKHKVMLIPHNIVDGHLNSIYIGVDAPVIPEK
ncbi:MAG: hypothetical protein WCO98_02285 [bacterium]